MNVRPVDHFSRLRVRRQAIANVGGTRSAVNGVVRVSGTCCLRLRQVRRQVDLALPGATVNLLVLWCYELRWRKPPE